MQTQKEVFAHVEWLKAREQNGEMVKKVSKVSKVPTSA
jgi:hypothetical protein